ncbi:uncharacterized protein TNCT_4071 [Trichonephila clavata]|uniref:DUF5641 domain-containing protein n=1 Tax=Trichonephila clavata TaxID=2740835 RepID=A0A8X6EX99_TRICU|nr:uncharacterized protein TNCT_4071 [Trichonephila clavata]
MPRTKRKNKSSKLSIQKRWCTETKTESNMDISEHNSNVAQRSSGDRILKNERISMQKKSVLEQENIADTYDGPSYIIVDKNALCDIFKYTLCSICNQSTLKLEFGHKYGFSHQLKLVCKTCSEQKMECFTSPRLEKKSNTSTPFDVNVRAVQAFLAISGGHASVEKFCMFLNMPLMSNPNFHISKPIDVLLGAEIYANLLEGLPILGPAGTPAAIPTKLGYILSRKIYAPPLQESIVNSILNVTNCQNFRNWKKFLKLMLKFKFLILVKKVFQNRYANTSLDRWHKEVLYHYQSRPKWKTSQSEVQVGNLVLISDDNRPPLSWPMARILKLIPGTDESHKLAILQTGSGLTRRSINKIVVLPICAREDGDSEIHH